MMRITRRGSLLTGLLFAFGRSSEAAAAAGQTIGAAYLRARPLDPLTDLHALAGLPRGQLAARVRADFAAGRVVVLDGWMLSETEARLCALALRNA